MFLNKNRVKLVIFLSTFLVIMNCVSAQTPYLKHFTVDDGLPSSNVYTAFQDSLGIVWFGTDKGITRFDGYSFKSFNMSEVNASADVWGIHSDIKGRLWFSSMKQLTYLENGRFKAIPFPENKPFTIVERQYIDKKGNHFVKFQNAHHLYKVDVEAGKILPFEAIKVENISHKIHFLKEDDNNNLWFLVTIANEVFLFKVKNGIATIVDKYDIGNITEIFLPHPFMVKEGIYKLIIQEIYLEIDLEKEVIRSIDKSSDIDFLVKNNRRITNDLILLDVVDGYKVINKKDEVQTDLEFINQFLLNDLFEDKQGNIWLCTNNDGLYFLPKSGRDSKTLQLGNSLNENDISTLTLDGKGRLWFTNKNLDLSILQEDGTIHTIHFEIQNPTKNNLYFDDLIFDNQGNLFIGSNEDLLILIKKEAIETLFSKTRISLFQTHIIRPNRDIKITDNDGIIGFYGPVIKSFDKYENQIILSSASTIVLLELNDDRLRCYYQDRSRIYTSQFWRNKVWVGTKRYLATLEYTDEDTLLQKEPLFPYPINDLKVSNNDKLWIATDGLGLFRFDGENIDTIQALIDTRITIKNMYVDEDNSLWIATNRGIGLIEITNEKPFRYNFRMFTKANGLIADEVNAISKKGNEIYVATSKGLTILDEKKLLVKLEKHPLVFTKLTASKQEVDLSKPVNLSYNQNNIRIEYLCLSYGNIGNIQYEYRMKGIDKTWQSTNSKFKDYPILPSGEYTFQIRAKSIDGTLTDTQTLNIVIQVPWWSSWAAYIIYILIILIITYLIFNFQLKRANEQQEKNRLEELTNLKSRFYANITHEFRTPLTLIMGLNSQLKSTYYENNQSTFEIIERHSVRLLNLINQLLDLNKLEAKAMLLKYQNSDIISYSRYLVNLFIPAAMDKKIQLTFYNEQEELFMDFDSDIIQSILFNLISNAIKYTNENGQVIVHIGKLKEKESLQIKIIDNGIGISTDAQALIFNRFFQEKKVVDRGNNTGIGLALVKELTERVGGDIKVKSSNKGTTFTVNLPISQKYSVAEQPIVDDNMATLVNAYFPIKKMELDVSGIDNQNKPTLLLVEDDDDLRTYLGHIIGQYYDIVVAKDGAEGIEEAIKIVPDLIISDLMMPNKNGYELCEYLRDEEITSHIPIILLTAKASKEAELEGLKAGADVYMVKPFHQEELILRINQLLERRKQLINRYQGGQFTGDISPNPKVEKEDQFMLKVRAVIEDNIDDYNLNVAFLCNQLYISRAQLHKKITYLTGASTTKYIKKVKLQKAEELLAETDLNITEIAYKTGFEVKYFSKVFKQTYDISPSEYRKDKL